LIGVYICKIIKVLNYIYVSTFTFETWIDFQTFRKELVIYHSTDQKNIQSDVSKIDKLNAELALVKNDLNEFIHLASHDIKAPLNAIDHLTDWLVEDLGPQISEENLNHLDLIKSRARRAKLLISDLSLYSLIGSKTEEHEFIDFKQAVMFCVEQINTDKFQLDIAGCDLVLPKQSFISVLTQLISNAVKHHVTDTGKISIKCKKLLHAYQIKVRDDGPSIHPRDHKKIFKKFKTLKSRDDVEGSGMGLAIVEKILSIYAANITLESDGQSGSTFIIEWPFGPKLRTVG